MGAISEAERGELRKKKGIFEPFLKNNCELLTEVSTYRVVSNERIVKSPSIDVNMSCPDK